MAADLQALGYEFVDTAGNVLAAPVIGEQVFIRALWDTTDLLPTDRYQVRINYDSATFNSPTIAGVPGVDMLQSTVFSVGFAFPGQHRVELFVDSNNAIDEGANEVDNRFVRSFFPAAPLTLPGKFVFPIQGTQDVDFMVSKYVDVGGGVDYRQGSYTRSQQLGIEINLQNFAAMDAGVPVRAATSGVVTRVQNGNFDRETDAFAFASSNFVEIDHGNGWFTRYLHLANNSTTVVIGQSVTAGQIIGLVGSSGTNSGFSCSPFVTDCFYQDARLEFQVEHNGAVVETFIDPQSYWFEPAAYQGDLPYVVFDRGVTNVVPTLSSDLAVELREQPDDIQILHPTFVNDLTLWYRLTHLNNGDTYRGVLYWPDGTRDQNPLQFAFDDETNIYRTETFARNWALHPGTWVAALEINGVEVTRTSFRIESEPLLPELRVSQNNTIILDDRITPIDFGNAIRGATPVTQTVVFQNHGSGVLHLSNLKLPDGFSVVGNFPAQVNPGENIDVTFQLDTTVAGAKFGEVRFTTDDVSNPVFNFLLAGTVTGAPVAGAPTITLSNVALSYVFESPALVLEPNAIVRDVDSFLFTGGRLTVTIESGSSPGDVLGIHQQGLTFGQVATSGNTVLYGGADVGTWSGGSNGVPLTVDFNSSADVPTVEAVVRNINYQNTLAVPNGRPRYVQFKLTDDTGKVSNLPIKTIVLGADVLNIVPVVTRLDTSATTITDPGSVTLTALGVGDVDGVVKNVAFYLESNNINGLQPGIGGDRLLSTDFDGSDGWTSTFSSAGVRPGVRTLYAMATDDRFDTSHAAAANVTVFSSNIPPAIVFMGANPTQLVQPAVSKITANGVTDDDGLIARVDFYVDDNGVPGLQTGVGGDTLIGSDNSSVGGYAADFSSAGRFDGKYTIYGVAVDNLGGTNDPISVTVTVGTPPPRGSLISLADLLVANGGNGTAGAVLNGTAGDAAGSAVSLVGDVNGDGYDDFVVGAPAASPGVPARNQAGVAYVVFGQGNLPAEQNFSGLNGSNGFRIAGVAAADAAGINVSGLGDINGDGFADLAVGVTGQAGSAGAVYVLLGKATGFAANLDLATLTAANGFRISGINAGDDLSRAAGIGDINGDGLADFALGANGFDVAGAPALNNAGSAYIVLGRKTSFGTSLDVSTLDGTTGFRISGLASDDLLGSSIAAAGDFNGDGFGDVVIGAPGASPGAPARANAGSAFVVFGKATAFPSNFQLATLNGANGVRMDGVLPGDGLGNSVSTAGDVNDDGISDLLLGASNASPFSAGSGEVFLVYGRTSFATADVSLTTLTSATGARFRGVSVGAGIGQQVSAAGDVNGDGVDDVIIGARRIDMVAPTRNDIGEAYVVYGQTGGVAPQINTTSLDGTNGFRVAGVSAGDKAGRAVAGNGDVNGDGFDDLLVGAPGALAGAGQSFVIYGGDWLGRVTAIGDAAANQIEGTANADTLIAGAGNDSLIGNGNADVMKGGVGDDTLLVLDTSFKQVDGGHGSDKLALDGSGRVLDLATAAGRQIVSIEKFDITGTGNNTLSLTAAALRRLAADTKQFVVTRNQGDVVNIGPGWTLRGIPEINGVRFNQFVQGDLQLLVTAVAEGAPWRNPGNALDVNNDSSVAPSDVLAIINYLNAHPNQNNPLPNPAIPPNAPPPLGTQNFFDVNGDGFVSAIDALMVINFLNEQSGTLNGAASEGEGESTSADESPAIHAGVVLPISAASASNNMLATSNSPPTSSTSVSTVATAALPSLLPQPVTASSNASAGRQTASATDSAWDDLLDTLAADISDAWNS